MVVGQASPKASPKSAWSEPGAEASPFPLPRGRKEAGSRPELRGIGRGHGFVPLGRRSSSAAAADFLLKFISVSTLVKEYIRQYIHLYLVYGVCIRAYPCVLAVRILCMMCVSVRIRAYLFGYPCLSSAYPCVSVRILRIRAYSCVSAYSCVFVRIRAYLVRIRAYPCVSICVSVRILCVSMCVFLRILCVSCAYLGVSVSYARMYSFTSVISHDELLCVLCLFACDAY